MKKSLFLILAFLPFIAHAQWADLCTVSGHIYWPDGAAADSVHVYVVTADRDGGIFFNGARRYTTDSTGYVSFTVPRTRSGDTTFVGIKAPVSDWAFGRVAVIPDAPSAEFSAITTTQTRYSIPVLIPHLRVTNGANSALVDTVTVLGAGVTVTYSAWSKVTIDVGAASADQTARDSASVANKAAQTALERANIQRDTSRTWRTFIALVGGCLSIDTTTPARPVITLDTACIRAGLPQAVNVLHLDTANANFIRGLVAAATFARIDTLAKLAGTLGYKIAIVNIDTVGFGARYMGVMTESDPTAIKADTASLAPIADQMYSRSGGASQWGTSPISIFPILPNPYADSLSFRMRLGQFNQSYSASDTLIRFGIPTFSAEDRWTEKVTIGTVSNGTSVFISGKQGLYFKSGLWLNGTANSAYGNDVFFSGSIGTWAFGNSGGSHDIMGLNYYATLNSPAGAINSGSAPSAQTWTRSGNSGFGILHPMSKVHIVGAARADSVLSTYGVFTDLRAQGAGTVLKADSAIFRKIVIADTLGWVTGDSVSWRTTKIMLPSTFQPRAASRTGYVDFEVVAANTGYAMAVCDFHLVSDSTNNVKIAFVEALSQFVEENGSGAEGTRIATKTYVGITNQNTIAQTNGDVLTSVSTLLTAQNFGTTSLNYAVRFVTSNVGYTVSGYGAHNFITLRAWYKIPPANTSTWFLKIVEP